MKLGQLASGFLGAMLALLLLLQSPAAVVALDPEGAAAELMALTNLNRTTNGLAALLVDQDLKLVARSRSEDMIRRNYFSHEIPPDNHTVIDILESVGVPFRSAGENIEWNTAPEFSTVQYASTDFMNSPSHRVNILNGRYNRIGAGVEEGSGRRMYAVVFVERPPARPAVQAPTPAAPVPTPPQATPELTRTPTAVQSPTAETPGGSATVSQQEGTPSATSTASSETPSPISPTVLPASATAELGSPSPVQPTIESPLPLGSQRLAQLKPARLTLLEAIISELVRLFLNL